MEVFDSKTALYFLIGFIFWALSLRFKLRDYGNQPIILPHVVVAVVILILYALIDLVALPVEIEKLLNANAVIGGIRAWSSSQPVIVSAIVYIVLTDFAGYWIHRIMHETSVWRFHSLHHSPKHLNWVSGGVGSPVQLLLIYIPSAIFAYLFLKDFQVEALLAIVFLESVSQHSSHSNVKAPFEKYLEYVIVTPRMHFVHHHPNPKYTDSNYGFYLSIWDHLFGTYTDADSIPSDERGKLGLDYEESTASQFLGLNRRKPAAQESTRSRHASVKTREA